MTGTTMTDASPYLVKPYSPWWDGYEDERVPHPDDLAAYQRNAKKRREVWSLDGLYRLGFEIDDEDDLYSCDSGWVLEREGGGFIAFGDYMASSRMAEAIRQIVVALKGEAVLKAFDLCEEEETDERGLADALDSKIADAERELAALKAVRAGLDKRPVRNA